MQVEPAGLVVAFLEDILSPGKEFSALVLDQVYSGVEHTQNAQYQHVLDQDLIAAARDDQHVVRAATIDDDFVTTLCPDGPVGQARQCEILGVSARLDLDSVAGPRVGDGQLNRDVVIRHFDLGRLGRARQGDQKKDGDER